MVRALASHQCGPGSIPGPDATSGLSLCWFSSLLRWYFSGFSGFPPKPKTSIQLISAGCKLCSKVTNGPCSGCQRRLCMLSVRNVVELRSCCTLPRRLAATIISVIIITIIQWIVMLYILDSTILCHNNSLSLDVFFPSFSLAKSSPRDLQITGYN